MKEQPKFASVKQCEIHETAIIYDQVNLYKCKIGAYTKIDSFVYIEENVIIGSNCKIRPFCFIPTGVTIGNHVFIGPGVTFTNDRYPKTSGDWTLETTIIEDNVSIGARTVILPGITIGKNSLVGAGSVVTKDIPSNTVAFGNPAKTINKGNDS